MSKHTPGPWSLCFASEGKNLPYEIYAPDSNEFKKRPLACIDSNGENGEHFSANADLIAAAPELLEVAKLIIEEWEKPTDGVQRGELIARLSQYARKAGHAIAKAEGRNDGSYKGKE